MDRKIKAIEKSLFQKKPKKAMKELKQLEKMDKRQDEKLRKAGIKPE